MKELLYNLGRNKRIKIEGLKSDKGLIGEFNFHHVDGMYSLCTDDEGNTFHLKADTLVEVVGNLNTLEK